MGACHRAGGGPTQLARLPGGGRGLICHLGDREDVWVGLLLACRGRNIGHASSPSWNIATRNTALQHVLELLLIRTSWFTYHATDRGANLKMMMKGLRERFDGL